MQRCSTLGVSLVVLFLAGCAGSGDNFKEPKIELNQVVVRGLGVAGGNLDLIVDIDNPNGFTLRGTKLEVGFDVEGSHVGDIEYDDEYTVQENEVTTLTLPLRFRWSGVGGAFRSALQYGDIPYEMKGQATIRTPFGRRLVPFEREGRAPLTRSGGVSP